MKWWRGSGPKKSLLPSAWKRALPRPSKSSSATPCGLTLAGRRFESKITSLRKVDWGSMRANFFVIYPVSQMDNVPTTYMGAFKAPATKGFDNALVRQFPNVTNVDMTSTIAQVQRVLDQVIRAVEFLFGFTLAAGLVVLFAAVTATREERAREYAIMRAVGAKGSLLRQVQRAELAGVGLLGRVPGVYRRSRRGLGAGASLCSNLSGPCRCGCLCSVRSRWQAGGAWCGAGSLAAGWWGLREVLNRPVVETLRRAQKPDGGVGQRPSNQLER
jgi:putative ABC transport system permease protein